MGWKILLDGDERAQAEARIAEIVAALPPEGLAHPGLAGGTAGVALVCGALARAGGSWERAEAYVDQAVGAVSDTVMGPSLYSGFTGVAWVLDHLAADDSEDANEDIDAALLEHLSASPWRGDYDVINGLCGFGAYAFERVRRRRAASATALLERVLARLEELAVEVPGAPGATFLTSPELMIPETAARAPRGYYNLGLAHGVPGVIALLGAMIDAGVAPARARALLERAVTWFLAQRRTGADGSQFAYTADIPPSDTPHRTRTAWCYGDPGIAVALLWAGQCAGRDDWIAVAAELGRLAAARPDETAGVVDAGLCHGSAGLALIYNRMWQATGDEAFAEAARRWVRRTFAYHMPGQGTGGYRAWLPIPGSGTLKPEWVDDPGLLTGSAGVALGLHACVSDVAPDWDLFLLTSAKPRP